MSIAALGSVMQAGGTGRTGVVVSATRVGKTPDGDDLVRYQIRAAGGGDQQPAAAAPAVGNAARPPAGKADEAAAVGPAGARLPNQLSDEEKRVVEALRRRDAAVRREEEAHAAVAGKYGSPPVYTYERGPDGRLYRVGGAVAINATVSGDPEELRRAGSRITAAAFAPVRPSSADRSAALSGYLFAAKAGQGGSDDDRRAAVNTFA